MTLIQTFSDLVVSEGRWGMAVDKARVRKLLLDYQELGLDVGGKRDEMDFLPAICRVFLGEYEEARSLFERSLLAMFSPPRKWRKTAQPHWLADTGILAGRRSLLPLIVRELEAYKAGPQGNWYTAYYSYAMMELWMLKGAEARQWIEGLLRDKDIKDGYAMGQTLQAVVENDQEAFNAGLKSLLKVQEGMVRRGGLRDTAEGLLCMPAMSLACLALLKGMRLEVESEYLSAGYLGFLLDYREP
jgi:hypothetical protein